MISLCLGKVALRLAMVILKFPDVIRSMRTGSALEPVNISLKTLLEIYIYIYNSTSQKTHLFRNMNNTTT